MWSSPAYCGGTVLQMMKQEAGWTAPVIRQHMLYQKNLTSIT